VRLAVEEMFYLMFSILAVLLMKVRFKSERALLMSRTFILLLSTMLRFLDVYFANPNWNDGVSPIVIYFFSRTALFSATSLGFALLMPAVMDLSVPRKSVVEALWRNMALWSYSLYLSNLLIYNLIQTFWVEPAHKTKFNAILATVAYLAVSVLLSAFVYRHYELPMMKLRDSSSMARTKRWSLNRA